MNFLLVFFSAGGDTSSQAKGTKSTLERSGLKGTKSPLGNEVDLVPLACEDGGDNKY